MGVSQQHIEAFLEMLGVERGAASNTIEAYRRDLEKFSAHLTSQDTELTAASERDIADWLEARSAEGISAASRARG
ncbi:MAG TPA: site-specific integrase, partial [Hyphomicrobium sp.]|nr:site-specific integrase [Hyphomicrobium sp.]